MKQSERDNDVFDLNKDRLRWFSLPAVQRPHPEDVAISLVQHDADTLAIRSRSVSRNWLGLGGEGKLRIKSLFDGISPQYWSERMDDDQPVGGQRAAIYGAMGLHLTYDLDRAAIAVEIRSDACTHVLVRGGTQTMKPTAQGYWGTA